VGNILALLLGLSIVPLHAQEITVAAAADLHFALDELASRFQAESGIRIKPIYGSSGNFYQQIQSGAPFDLFLSANVEYPKKLEAAGLTVPGTYYEYARGKIVLVVAANSPVDLKQGMRVLLSVAVKKISIANPAHAPYGAAAVSALKTEGIYDQVSPKLVTAENISEAASFVASGAADVGIVALSLVHAPASSSQLRIGEIPAGDYAPIQQACVALRSSKNLGAAKRFEFFLRSKEAAEIFQRYGFDVPTR
jgi:molybdate transport system substrate-binding protein